jgi:hypothetical protein
MALDPIPTQQLGAITGNDLNGMERFAAFLGRPQDHDLLAFNQNDWRALESSVDYTVGLGKQVIAAGRRVHWSVPVAGSGGYELIATGHRDALYTRMAASILSAYGEGTSRILIRPPWEFNADFQTQRAKDISGVWAATLYATVFRHIVGLFRDVSPRFYFDWCPNVGTEGVAPELCYPGDRFVDVVSVDIYFNKKYDDKFIGDAGASMFDYRKTEDYGLNWLSAFAISHRKLIGISEWGVDDNNATVYMSQFCNWIISRGARLSHHNYWDRPEGINCEITKGDLPALGKIYRDAFRNWPDNKKN